MADVPPKRINRQGFAAQLGQLGVKLDADEFASVFGTVEWLEIGLAQLSPAAADAPAAADDADADLSIIEAGRRLRNGTLTSVALTRAVLARIRSRDPHYLAFYEVTEARALASAHAADADLAQGNDRGPLHGIPIALKDLIDLAGVRCTAGSRGLADRVPDKNAIVVDRLIAGGAVIVGKLATYEWGTVGPAYDTLFPPSRNPWSFAHITGGSSSGSATAVAGGLLRTTLGSDTGGSLRGPSSYCGTVGLKPTFGLVPTDGVLAMSPSMDHVGPISASSAEAAITLDVISGRTGPHSAAWLLGQPLTGLRIAYGRDWFANDPQCDPAVREAMDMAASTLSELGAVVERVSLPDYPQIEVAAAAVLLAEGFAGHREALAAHPEGYGRKTYQSIVGGAAITAEQLARAQAAGAEFRGRMDREIFDNYDALLTVCALTPALPLSLFGKGSVWTPMRTIGFNLSGHPVLALPMGFSDGLPLGMQLVGRHFHEARICQIGDAFERATDFSTQRPAPPPR
jgi:Asp-tRNA(Asn)/Glu-tRNA(Gln) amidotransferase A subunit family amidase